jgi:hypothetical protein
VTPDWWQNWGAGRDADPFGAPHVHVAVASKGRCCTAAVQWVLQPIEAIRALGLRCSREELEVFLSRHDHELSAVALAVLDELLYMPGVAEAERESIPYGILSVSCTDPNNYLSEPFKTFSRKSRNSEHAMSLYGG